PRSLHFFNRSRSLIVSYLEHGVVCWSLRSRSVEWCLSPEQVRIGRSALSSDHKYLALSNLFDGFDLYRLPDGRFLKNFPGLLTDNVPIPLCFVHDGTALLFGSSSGLPTLWSVKTCSLLQGLRHPSTTSLALQAYNDFGSRYIATATAETGGDTHVKVWQASPLQRSIYTKVCPIF
ncbi:hypothetical protein BV25DRAFT_1817164, partial [Artomyces pyxidatus]